eukprot:g318.t1
MKLSSLVGGVMALAVSFAATAASAETWRIQTLFPPDNINFKQLERVAEKIDTMSDGRLTLELIPVKQVVGPTGTLDAVKTGIIDGHFTWPGLWAGREPAFALVADLPGGFPSAHEALEFYYAGPGLELTRELHAEAGLYTVGVFCVGTESLPSRAPIRGIEDLDGLKIRLPGGVTSMVMAKFGVAPVQLPFSEAFTALDKGTVDASDNSSISENARMGFHDSAKYAIYPGIHSAPVLDLSVNLDKWNALPDDLKAILETAMHSVAETSMYARDAFDRQVLAEIAAGERDIEVIDWPASERRAFREAAKTVWLEYAEKSEMSKKVADAQIHAILAGGRMRLLLALSHLIGRLSAWSAFVYLIVTAIICYDVVARYLFAAPTFWALELSIILAASQFMLGGVKPAGDNSHVRIDGVYHLASAKVRRWMDVFSALVAVFYLSFASYYCWKTAVQAITIWETSASVWDTPSPTIIKTVIALSFTMVMIQYLILLARWLVDDPPPASREEAAAGSSQ